VTSLGANEPNMARASLRADRQNQKCPLARRPRSSLPDHWEPSSQAVVEAASIGIVLREHETWVRPHVRGLDASESLTFSWRVPNALATQFAE
jgi:hypothetical protein